MLQGLWQSHYQILLINSLKEVVKLNVNSDTMIKKCGNCRIKYKYCDCFLGYINLNDDDLIEYKRLCCNNNYQQNFDMKSYRNDF